MKRLIQMVLLTISLSFSFQSIAAISAYDFDNDEQAKLFQDLTKELRCPKCQNNNIADSNAPLAQDLREKTYEMVKQGQNRDQVLQYMVDRYGNFVRYDPPLTPAVMMLWAAPILVILLGAFLLWRLSSKSRSSRSAKPDLSEAEQKRLAAIIKSTENK